MGTLDSILASHAVACTQHFGESWQYTSADGNTTKTLTIVVDRHQPEVVTESGITRKRCVTAFIAANSTVGLTTRPNRGDLLKGTWQIGATAENFRIVAIISQDPGGWTVRADAAGYTG